MRAWRTRKICQRRATPRPPPPRRTAAGRGWWSCSAVTARRVRASSASRPARPTCPGSPSAATACARASAPAAYVRASAPAACGRAMTPATGARARAACWCAGSHVGRLAGTRAGRSAVMTVGTRSAPAASGWRTRILHV